MFPAAWPVDIGEHFALEIGDMIYGKKAGDWSDINAETALAY
jgi:hypothetical protein